MFYSLVVRLLILLHVKHPIPYLIHNRLAEDEPSGSKLINYLKIKNLVMLLENLYFVGFLFYNNIKCTRQKN